MRILSIVLAAAAVFTASSAALASGTTRVQQADGSVQIYDDVSIVYANQALRITSADNKGTLIISKGACSYVGQLQRCYPYEMTLAQNGGEHPLDFERGTVYYNPTDTPQALPLSSTQVPPKGIICFIKTKRGTFIAIHGTLDKVVKE
jgi:hypothetical protein